MGDRQEALPLPWTLPAPIEDGGAVAQANFRFQCEVTARFCYGLLEDSGPFSVLCEYYEDFIVMHRNHGLDLLSVKHRDLNQGVWSLVELCSKGGLTHLFDRWQRITADHRRIRAVAITNAGLANGHHNAAELKKLCAGGWPDPAERLDWAKVLTRHFLTVAQRIQVATIPKVDPPKKPGDLDDRDPLVVQVSNFLTSLSFVTVPHRDDICATTILEVARPLFLAKRWNERDVDKSHDNIVNMIAKAVGTFGGRPIDLIQELEQLDRPFGAVQRDSLLAARTIDTDRILNAITHTGNPSLFPPGEQPLPAPGGADLLRKMAGGGLPPTKHQLAERWRSAWYTTQRAVLPNLPGDAAVVGQIETEILELVVDAQDVASSASQATDQTQEYGSALFTALREGVRVADFRQPPPLDLNDQHALGVAFELCDQCEFDFRPPQPLVDDSDAIARDKRDGGPNHHQEQRGQHD